MRNELKKTVSDFITDYAKFAYAVNEQTTKDPHLLKLLRALVLICRRNNILFTALHSRGATENITADSLSHLQVEEYKISGSGYAPNVNPTAGSPVTRGLIVSYALTQLLELLGLIANLSNTSLSYTFCRPSLLT